MAKYRVIFWVLKKDAGETFLAKIYDSPVPRVGETVYLKDRWKVKTVQHQIAVESAVNYGYDINIYTYYVVSNFKLVISLTLTLTHLNIDIFFLKKRLIFTGLVKCLD